MYNILSSGCKTVLNDFDDFSEIFSYSHFNDKSEDFQLFPDSSLFSSFNRSSGFELRRIIKNNDKDVIQRVKKRLLNDISAIASSTIRTGDIALGFTNGSIKFFNFKQAQFSPVQFKPVRPNSSVICLDYSKNCEMLAGIYENDNIGLYGLNTNIRMDKIPTDKNPTVLRFNPSKQFSLGIVSYDGSLSVVDPQARCFIFRDKAAHTAPCIDFSWCPDTPNNLITVGYDCYINLYDCRIRSLKLKVLAQHPLSSVCVSHCGHYCCAGNLKGDIYLYDVRNMKNLLRSQRVHNGNIVRVAFVPKCTDSITFAYESFNNPQSELVERSSDDDISIAELADIVQADQTPDRVAKKPARDSISDLLLFKPVSIDDSPHPRSSMINSPTDSAFHINKEKHIKPKLSLRKNENNDKKSRASELVMENVEPTVSALKPTPEIVVQSSVSRKSESHVSGKLKKSEEQQILISQKKRRRCMSPEKMKILNNTNNNNTTSHKHILLEQPANIQSMESEGQYSSTPKIDKVFDNSSKENKISIHDLSGIPNRTPDAYQTTPSYSKSKIKTNILLKQDVPKKCDSCKMEIENLKKFFTDQITELKESNAKQMMELVKKLDPTDQLDSMLSTLQNHVDGSTMSIKFQLWQLMEEQQDFKSDVVGLLKNMAIRD